MMQRFNQFSHIENLFTGSLVLEDPFSLPREQVQQCRYELHRQTAEILDGVKERNGLARWHRLLHLSESQLPENLWVAKISPITTPLAEECAAVLEVTTNPELPYATSLPMVAAASYTETFALSLTGTQAFLTACPSYAGIRQLLVPGNGEGGTYATTPDQAVQSCRQAGTADCAPWGNPFRLEGWKALGLDLLERYREKRPTLVVHDPIGELLYGLQAACAHYRDLGVEPPCRLILVQQQPYAPLCGAYEGRGYDQSQLDDPTNRTVLSLPEPLPARICKGLDQQLGTAIALAEDEGGDNWLEPVLHRLVRTGFVDDEDTVLALRAPY